MNITYTVHSAVLVPVQVPATLADGTVVQATISGAVYELITSDGPSVTLSAAMQPGAALEFAAGDTVVGSFIKQAPAA